MNDQLKVLSHLMELFHPQTRTVGETQVFGGGITKREWFAGLAMQNLQNVLLRKSGEDQLRALLAAHKDRAGSPEELIAMLAVVQADCLIEQLGKLPCK